MAWPRLRCPVPHVLVVDDEPAVLRALTLSLKGRFAVTGVTSAAEAIDALAGGQAFDAIVCDVNMPEMDGRELYRTVRSRRPELTHRFVFVTGDVALPNDPFFEALPIHVKPVPRAILRAAVEAVLIA